MKFKFTALDLDAEIDAIPEETIYELPDQAAADELASSMIVYEHKAVSVEKLDGGLTGWVKGLLGIQ